MSRTRIRQFEQIDNSILYEDSLNQGDGTGAATEGQPGANIGANNAIVSTTTSTIVVAQNLVALGVNSDDEVSIVGSASNDGTYKIVSLVFGTPNTTLTVDPVSLDGSTTLSAGGASGNAQVKVNSTKSLERDLNHIRTQLRKLNQTDDWFDDPAGQGVPMFATATRTEFPAGTEIDVGGNYDAGSPYDLSVYLNGDLLAPSVISGGSVVTEYDYQEVDIDGNLVEAGDVGRKIVINFDIVSGDVFHFVWTR